MKKYPSIPNDAEAGRPSWGGPTLYVFDKLDGSNVRAEWTRKKGFWKFGKRNHLVGQDDSLLGEAQGLIESKYGDDLARIFTEMRLDKAIAFFEYYGPNSFAGNHEDEEHTVTLLDVAPHKRGIIEPREFLKRFGGLEHPALLHQGNVNHEFAEGVRNGELEGMSFEGVICKGKYSQRLGHPFMFKIKNRAWVDKVRQMYRENDRKLKELL